MTLILAVVLGAAVLLLRPPLHAATRLRSVVRNSPEAQRSPRRRMLPWFRRAARGSGGKRGLGLTLVVQQLAALLHTFYNKHRILPPAADAEVFAQGAPEMARDEGAKREALTPERTAARLALMRGVQQVIRNGLAVLGISAPDQM